MEKLWLVHSGGRGFDELLVGADAESIVELLAAYHEWESIELPTGWALEEIAPANVTARDILGLATEEQREELLGNGRFPTSQPWGDGRAYPLECGDWIVDTGDNHAEEGWCEGYACGECGEIYTDQHPCRCEERT